MSAIENETPTTTPVTDEERKLDAETQSRHLEDLNSRMPFVKLHL